MIENSGMKKEAVIVHSGGMDSSICLALARERFGTDACLSLSFNYSQRHSLELERAAEICHNWGVDHTVLPIHCLAQITRNSLTDRSLSIQEGQDGAPPNSLVEGRNGLMARLAAIHAKSLGAGQIYMGVIEVEEANSGYRDCSRHYMDLMQCILRLDLALPTFEICTPLVFMSKAETMAVAQRLGVLDYLLDRTISCYEGLPGAGCGRCPACYLRNEGIQEFRSQDRRET
jgi:7-cyano-7-deazaguanine synthase